MIVFGASLSPFVRKVLAAAAEKGIEVENKIRPPGSDPDPDFLAASPFRKIPALKDGDFLISDSSAIIHYFEAVKPEPALIPAEARARAQTIWYEEFADTIFSSCMGKMFFNRIVSPMFMGRAGDLDAAAKAEAEELPPIFDYIEKVAPAPGAFLVGETITLADIAVASQLANIGHLKLDTGRWPKMTAWAESMHARPSFATPMAMESRILSSFGT
jgi:glutathione S-transferase